MSGLYSSCLLNFIFNFIYVFKNLFCCVFSGSSRGEPISSPFLASRSCLHSLTRGPPITPVFASIVTSLAPLPPSFPCKDPCDFIGPTGIIRIISRLKMSSFVMYAKSPLPCGSQHKLGFRGLGHGHLWGTIILLTTGSHLIFFSYLSAYLPISYPFLARLW